MTDLPNVSPKGREQALRALTSLERYQRVIDSIYALESRIAKGHLDLAEAEAEFAECLTQYAEGNLTADKRYRQEAIVFSRSATLDALIGSKRYLDLDKEKETLGYKILMEEIHQGYEYEEINRWLTEKGLTQMEESCRTLSDLINNHSTLTTK